MATAFAAATPRGSSMKFASTRLIATDIAAVVRFYETLTGQQPSGWPPSLPKLS
jgi:hypothetical protein